jgi:hypothetical protein
MTDWLKLASDNHDAILLLEVAGLLHDIGKMSDEFLKSKAKDSDEESAFEFAAVVEPAEVFGAQPSSRTARWLIGRVTRRKSLFELLEAKVKETLLKRQVTSGDDQFSLAELLLTQAHNYNRGERQLEQEWYQETDRSQNFSHLVRHLHLISHYEKEAREGDVDQEDQQDYTDMFLATPFGYERHIPVGNDGGLTAALRDLPLAELDKVLTDERGDWLSQIRSLMRRAPADTRRPANEVTLWDWGYTVASFAKAALPTVLAENWNGNWDNLQWRMLRVNLDIPSLLVRSNRIGDVLGAVHEIRGCFAKLKCLLEEEKAIANELYRDETGIYFIFPNANLPQKLSKSILACFPTDMRSVVKLEEAKLTAHTLDLKTPEEIAKLIKGPRAEGVRSLKYPISSANLPNLAGEWEGKRAEVCFVCGLRPVSTKQLAADQHVCHECFERREKRAEAWLADPTSTIWIDEASDRNGRAALLVGRLGLEGWLDGSLERTILWERAADGTYRSKNPSPARLRRVVAAAREFWETALETPSLPEAHGRRLAISGQTAGPLQKNHVYELCPPGGRAISAVWDGEGFISADNLVYAAIQLGWEEFNKNEQAAELQSQAGDRLMKSLAGRQTEIQEPIGYGGKNKHVGWLRDIQVEALPIAYRPYIPILAEPMWFQAVLPADHTLAAIRRIQEKYQAEMGKVRNRLPLSLGVIFFPRRTPLRAVIEAGRAMLTGFAQMDGESEAWTVKSTDAPAGCTPEKSPPAVRLALEHNGRSAPLSVNLRMGDRETSDLWYPYWQLADKRLKHTCELIEGDQVRFSPSRFDFEFLDTTARRFEISYGEDGRRFRRRSHPFLLDDLQRLEAIWEAMCHLEKSQRHQVISAIETAREDWFGTDSESRSWTDGVFRRFVHDTLAGAAWPAQYKWQTIETGLREQLIEAGATGQLADLAELHMEILKG